MPRTAPADVESLLARAHAHQQAGRPGPAEKLFREVLRIDPTEPRAAQLLAVILVERGEVDEAISLLELAKPRVGPPNADTFGFHNNYANALRLAGKHEDAEEQLRALTQAMPRAWQSWHNLGMLYNDVGRHDMAAGALRRAIALAPEHGPSHAVLGEVLFNMGRLRSAERSFQRCIELGWDKDPALWSWVGQCRRYLGRLEEAADALYRAYDCAPDHPDSRSNLGIVLGQLGRFDEAYEFLDAAIEVCPDGANYYANRGYTRLMGGDLAGGWSDWEYGLQGGPRGVERKLDVPRWTPDDPGTRVLVYREQGIGDEILFATCYPDIIAAAPSVVIETNPRLEALFKRSFPEAEVRAQTCTWTGQETLPEYDFDRAIPSGSLPMHFRPTVQHFPTRRSVLVADPERVDAWRQRLAELGPGPYVGISWRSKVKTAERRLEYTTLPEWGPLFSIPGVQWINLQYDDCERELVRAEHDFGVKIHRWDWLDLMNDFEEIAALNTCLDLVVAPRNAVAMLSGALGIPTVMMGNRWDWSDLGTDTSPWFPSVELVYRHTHEEWDAVLATAAARVQAIAKGNS